MKTKHMQEMAPWPDEQEKQPEPDFLFFKGILVGIPIGVALWTAILWGVW